MEDDPLKKAWQSQAVRPRLVLDAGIVLDEVRRNERQFAATIYQRDVSEVGVALLMVPIWIYMGIRTDSPWSWYLTVPALLWIAGFMIVDRVRQRRRQPQIADTLRSHVERSLAQVEHQIWLLRNIFWWYLLPPSVTVSIFFIHRACQAWSRGLAAVGIVAGGAAVFALVYWFLYWLNQYAVRKTLEPRRAELQTLLKSLGEAQ